MTSMNRRTVLGGVVSAAAAASLPFGTNAGAVPAPAARPIPSSGERIPLVGLGSWITFNVGRDQKLRDDCAAVVGAFFEAGGRMIDSSPMYGSSQQTIGYALEKLGRRDDVFSAEKVWISNPSRGPDQIEQSRSAWGVPRFDLMQVHNLLSWEAHLETLRRMKAAGEVRYIGITTSHGRGHREVVSIMERHQIDFLQVTYNAIDRKVEQRILPLARERGIAVIINRPYQRGALVDHVRRYKLPSWAAEAGASTWAQFLLKFVISHPAVTCAIPATTRVDHVRENMQAASGIMPDATLRARMADHVRSL
jgi:diketogulonate reductase-like aldo/keto reductase